MSSNIPWDSIPEATEDNKRAADLLIRLDDGQERRTGYDGGWLYYHDDTHTASNKQAISADTETLVSIDGAAADSDTSFRRGIPLDVWSSNFFNDTATTEIYTVSIDFKVDKATSSQTFVHMAGKIGSGYSTSITDERKPLTKGSGIQDFIVFNKILFVTNAFGADGLRFFLTFDEDVNIWDKAIFIQRTHSP
jgi:hypothetical protein